MSNQYFLPKAVFAVLILSVILYSCKKTSPPTPSTPPAPSKPVAAFDFNIKNQGTLPDTVLFTNNSTGATSFTWTFDDGNTSTQQSPSNIYKTVKTYNVKLVVAGAGGTDSVTKPITISLDKPKADFSFTIVNGGTLPTNVSFVSTSLRADSVLWRFDDGTTSKTSSPQVTYKSTRTYNVKLIAYNAAGVDSLVKQVTIIPNNNSVRIFLITPTDKPFNQAYYDILKATALNIQAYYKTQMGGKTFTLNDPVVDTLRGLHTYAWYNSDNGASISGTDPRFYGYYNTLYEISKIITTNTTLYTYVFYVAAPGGGAGATGQAALGDQDLDGLLSEVNNPVKRWIGGSAHEWGHAFGLPHPDNQLGNALMWTGYLTYPGNCILQQADKDILNASKFFK
jgi:PKD repeat protein